MKKISLFVLAFLVCFNARSQTASRVIAFAKYGADTTIPTVDSGGYKYAHGNGGEIFYDLNEFKEDFPFVYVPTYDFETGHRGLVKSDSSWETGPGDTDISIQFFDQNDNIIYSLCRIFKDGVWENYYSQTYIYDTNNNLIEQLDTSWVWDIELSTFNYDQNNRLIQEINLDKTSPDSNWSDGGKTIYTYDAIGNLTFIKEYGWVEKTNSWTNPDSVSTILTYTGNQPDTFIDQYQMGGAGGVYFFSPGNDTMVLNFYSYYNYLRITNTYDSNHNKTSTTKIVLDSTITNIAPGKAEWSYNTYGQVTCERTYIPDSLGNWVFNNLIRFYYETYTPEVPFSINNLTLFPSPAQGNITVKLELSTPQPFTCAIFDAAGHLVMQWSVPATQKYEQTINLPFVASGNYFFRAVAGKLKLVKQFVMLN